MADPPSPNPIIHPPPPSSTTPSNLSMLYYGLVIIGISAFVLVLYNLIVTKCCMFFSPRRAPHHQLPSRRPGPSSSWMFHYFNNISSFKYKKDGAPAKDDGDDMQCSVCLSVFEEGEELRQLPKCKHTFHASCIDMWLYAHMDCPLCRSMVGPPALERRAVMVMEQSEYSHAALVGPGILL